MKSPVFRHKNAKVVEREIKCKNYNVLLWLSWEETPGPSAEVQAAAGGNRKESETVSSADGLITGWDGTCDEQLWCEPVSDALLCA